MELTRDQVIARRQSLESTDPQHHDTYTPSYCLELIDTIDQLYLRLDLLNTVQISETQFQQFFSDWNKDQHPHQRIGQAFCNLHNITDPKLFYEQNLTKCINYIKEHYVQK